MSSPKGGHVKVGGGVAASKFVAATFAEVRLFPGNTFNIPLKIKWNEIRLDESDRKTLLEDSGLNEDTLGEDLHADFTGALEDFTVDSAYVSYTLGLASEWQKKARGSMLG